MQGAVDEGKSEENGQNEFRSRLNAWKKLEEEKKSEEGRNCKGRKKIQGMPETTSPCQTTATTKKRGRPPKTLHLTGQMKIQSFLVQKQSATSTSRIEREPSRIINENNSTIDAAKCQTLVGKKTIEVVTEN